LGSFSHRSFIGLAIFVFLSTSATVGKESEVAVHQSIDEYYKDFDHLRAKSYRSIRIGDLLYKPHCDKSGLAYFSIFRSKKCIMRKVKWKDYSEGDSVWLCFPFVGQRIKRVHTFDGHMDDFFLKGKTKRGSSPFIDLTGDGVPELIVAHNVGNGGNRYWIYSLGKTGKEITSHRAVRSDMEFMDIDSDGKFEALACDTTFYGWETCNACSPMPLVVLHLKGREFKLAPEFMKAKPPSKKMETKMLSEWKEYCEAQFTSGSYGEKPVPSAKHPFYLAPKVWGDMLDLIHSGNSKTALRLLDKFWPDSQYADNLENGPECTDVIHTSKQKFKSMFLKQLSYSPYLNDLKKLNAEDICMKSLRPLKRTNK